MKRSMHPTGPELIGWRESALPWFRQRSVGRHMARCATCRAWVESYGAITTRVERCLPAPEPDRYLDRAVLDAARAALAERGARPRAWVTALRPAAAFAAAAIALGVTLWMRFAPIKPSPPAAPESLVAAAAMTESILWQDPLTSDLDDQLEELELLINLAQEELYASNSALLPAPEEDLSGELEEEIRSLFQELEQES